MKVVILYDGTPVKLPASFFPPEKILFDIHGFLFRFIYIFKYGEIETENHCRYYTLSDFKQQDRSSFSDLEGYYMERDYLTYIQPNGILSTGFPIADLRQKKIDLRKYIANVGETITIDTLYNWQPFDYYFSKAQFTFQLESKSENNLVKNYRKEDLVDNSLILEIDIPESNLKEVVDIDSKSTPDGVFYKNNFLHHFIFQNANTTLTSRYKHIFTLISFQIHFITTEILEERMKDVINIQRVDGYADSLEEDISNLPGTTLEKIVFYIKKHWCYYYDPNAPTEQIHKALPAPTLNTLDIGELRKYYNTLLTLYSALYTYSFESNNSAGQETNLLFDLLYIIPDRALLALPYSALLLATKEFLAQQKLGEEREQSLVKVVAAIAKLEGNKEDFLDFLFIKDTVKDKSITNFEVLYKLLDDARLERYTIVNWFVDEKPNRKYFNYAIYEIWKQSKYNWEYIPPPPDLPVDFWSDNPVFNPELIIEIISSDIVIEERQKGKAHDFDTKIEGQNILIKACTRYEVQTSISTKTDLLVTKTIPIYEDLGKYHLYQPIVLTNYHANQELQLLDTLVYPAFLIHYIKEYDKLRDFDALVDLGINLVIEAALFFGTGGTGLLRHLRHIKYATKLGQALFRTKILDPNTSVLLWRGITAAGEAISMTAGMLANVGVYLETEENDPAKREVWEKLQFLMLCASIAAAGVSIKANQLTAQAAEDAYQAFIRLPTGVTIDPDAAELIALFRTRSLNDVNTFDHFLLEHDALTIRNWFNNSPELTDSYRKLFMGQYGLSKIEQIHLLNDTAVLQTWLTLAKAGVERPLRKLATLLELHQNQSRMTRVVQLYDEVDAKNVFEALDPKAWDDMLKTFIFKLKSAEVSEIISRIKERPALLVDFMKTHFSITKNGALDKLSVDNIFDIMRANLSDQHILFLQVKNSLSREKLATQFRRQLTEHETVSKQRITALMDGTAPELQGMNTLLKSDAQKMNVLLTKVDIYDGNTPIIIPSRWDIYLSSKNIGNNFIGGQPPSFVKDISPSSKSKFNAFKAQAIDAEGKKRLNDTEMKFIFHFLEEAWFQGNRFVIRIESTLKVCSSCEAYMAYLKEVGRQYGKEIEIHLKDNGDVLSFKDFLK
ncbi:hypothetical protein [Sphingobacterium yanglingense]|uniref:Uncharacterized protein n=1 Tax=Sphingobacterium yanglingense TaxID=1437280 RepID=A0A4R6WN11_9SPHI|nr:hypothetical protein [Sphingobacterium yanglingense]TDQ77461.1 hypothetical protein CLV99_2868 [Sphingobacterium yanglingense]